MQRRQALLSFMRINFRVNWHWVRITSLREFARNSESFKGRVESGQCYTGRGEGGGRHSDGDDQDASKRKYP